MSGHMTEVSHEVVLKEGPSRASIASCYANGCDSTCKIATKHWSNPVAPGREVPTTAPHLQKAFLM